MIEKTKKKSPKYFLDGGAGLLTFTHTINNRRGKKCHSSFCWEIYLVTFLCLGHAWVRLVGLHFFSICFLHLFISYFVQKKNICVFAKFGTFCFV